VRIKRKEAITDLDVRWRILKCYRGMMRWLDSPVSAYGPTEGSCKHNVKFAGSKKNWDILE
jgi:hypothetical protein